jgi:SAM-dependent methyltransferase
MLDSRDRFSAVASAYHRHRPGYGPGVLDWILATTSVPAGAKVADIGCGTGIFSRLLAGRGLDVVGIDPNADMLAMARDAGGGPRYRSGDATGTGLPDASVDLATAAQAFHWFPLEAALSELARILVPGGWIFAVWNQRVSSPFNDEYEDLLLGHSTEYAANRALSDLASDPRARLVGIPGAVTTEIPADEVLSWDEVIGRVRSASYVAHGMGDRDGFEREVRAAYERHRRPDGMLVWAMRTVAIGWVARPAAG